MNRLGVWVIAGAVTLALGACNKIEEKPHHPATPETAAPAESAVEPENKAKMMHDQKEEMQQEKRAENDTPMPEMSGDRQGGESAGPATGPGEDEANGPAMEQN